MSESESAHSHFENIGDDMIFTKVNDEMEVEFKCKIPMQRLCEIIGHMQRTYIGFIQSAIETLASL